MKSKIQNCRVCHEFTSQRAEPLITLQFPELPWQKLGMDLFDYDNSTYLLVVDYYSCYIEIVKLTKLNAAEVIVHCKSFFARHGIPEEVVSDNGLQFSAELFSKFARDYQFRHTTSSPYYPISNGEAERAVGTIKSLLNKTKVGDPYLALLSYRVTPLANGYSPSQLLMGRTLRSTVPISREARKPQIPDSRALQIKEAQMRKKQKENYDSRHGVRELTPFSQGDMVWVSDRREEGTIEGNAGPRSYEVETQSGSYRRNSKHLISLGQSRDNSEEDPPIDDNMTPEPNEQSTGSSQPSRSTRITSQPDRYNPSSF